MDIVQMTIVQWAMNRMTNYLTLMDRMTDLTNMTYVLKRRTNIVRTNIIRTNIVRTNLVRTDIVRTKSFKETSDSFLTPSVIQFQKNNLVFWYSNRIHFFQYFGATTLNTLTHSIMTIGIMTLSIITRSHDTQHNNTLHVICTECHCVECR
jgi:hypothetical protein